MPTRQQSDRSVPSLDKSQPPKGMTGNGRHMWGLGAEAGVNCDPCRCLKQPGEVLEAKPWCWGLTFTADLC